MSSATNPGSGAGISASRVVQVHPTLRCNLACNHCYTSSGPEVGGELKPQVLIARLERLRREGYDVVSFTGGEPMMYLGFDNVAWHARRMGFQVHTVSNGMLLSKRRIEKLKSVVGLMGLSLDGVPERHDRMRGERGAFHRMSRRLPWLRGAGLPFGFVHCVTRESLSDLPWVFEFALLTGARLLQIHALALAGRAVSHGHGLRLGNSDLARVHLLIDYLRLQARDRLEIQLDVTPVRRVLDGRASHPLFAANAAHPGARTLSDLVNPLVLDSAGQLWPLCHEMPAEQRIATGPQMEWEHDIDAYKAAGAAPLRDRLARAYEGLDDGGIGFVDWNAHVAQRRFSPPRAPRAVDLALLRATGQGALQPAATVPGTRTGRARAQPGTDPAPPLSAGAHTTRSRPLFLAS